MEDTSIIEMANTANAFAGYLLEVTDPPPVTASRNVLPDAYALTSSEPGPLPLEPYGVFQPILEGYVISEPLEIHFT